MLRIAAILLCLAGCSAMVLAAPATLYVSTRGNDAWSGKLVAPNAAGTDGPLATLEGARNAIRALKKASPLPVGGVTVTVQPGLYGVNSTLVLDQQDAGTPQAPVVYRGAEPQKPIVIGGKAITNWQPYQGHILKADVGAQGFKDIYFRQLLCNGARMDLARYPNRDADHPVTGGWAYVEGEQPLLYAEIPGESRKVLHYRESDARHWAHPEEGEVFIFPRFNWWNDILPIASVDPDKRTITLTADASYGIRPADRYFVQNLFEELDAPGEWYLDKATATLYFWPPDGVDPATMTVCAPAVRTILEMKDGAANITFRDFIFECADGTAISIHGTTDCRIAASVIRNVGDYNGSGVAIAGGKHNGVEGCDIHDVGRDAVSLDGGNYETLAPAENYADNNYIHHPGVFYKQGVGVGCNGVGNRISHNLIHDCPRFGISWGGSDHVFEYNEIRHCDLETADCGAIYSWQVDWTKRGTEIRYNYLHDIIGFGQENGKWTSPTMNWGVYLDDGTCGVHVHGNIVARTILGGVHVHGGRDNVIENNILVDGRDSQVQYSGYVKDGWPLPMLNDAWKKFAGTPAYLKYPGYEALTKSTADGWEMADNKFLRNIVSYREPSARLWAYYNLPFDKTESDYNLIWHYGAPILTGVQKLKNLSGDNLAPNPGFEKGEAGKLPDGWKWGVRPNDSDAKLDPDVHHEGKQVLRLDARGTVTDSSGQKLTVNFNSDNLDLKPGQTYVLSANVRADKSTSCSLMAQAYEPNKYWWAKPVHDTAGPDWKRIQTTFRFPAPGDSDYKEGMKTVCIRIDVSDGTAWVDDVQLHEAEVMSEWEAWQDLGLDKHSLIGDPLFVNAAGGNYRLKPKSPALALGFQPIPVDKIGPYQDDLRASWPIKEAIGAREQMKIDWSKH